MSEKSLPEIIEENKRFLRAEYEKGYLVGFKEAEKRSIGEFISDLNSVLIKGSFLKIKKKWEARKNEQEK